MANGNNPPNVFVFNKRLEANIQNSRQCAQLHLASCTRRSRKFTEGPSWLVPIRASMAAAPVIAGSAILDKGLEDGCEWASDSQKRRLVRVTYSRCPIEIHCWKGRLICSDVASGCGLGSATQRTLETRLTDWNHGVQSQTRSGRDPTGGR